MPDLQPCPFDGAKAEFAYVQGSWGYYPGKWGVKCTKCNACSTYYDDEKWEQGKGTCSVAEKAKQKAADWWNRRP